MLAVADDFDMLALQAGLDGALDVFRGDQGLLQG
jgi:hypothetical protein